MADSSTSLPLSVELWGGCDDGVPSVHRGSGPTSVALTFNEVVRERCEMLALAWAPDFACSICCELLLRARRMWDSPERKMSRMNTGGKEHKSWHQRNWYVKSTTMNVLSTRLARLGQVFTTQGSTPKFVEYRHFCKDTYFKLIDF